jgi:four helix bundle protein
MSLQSFEKLNVWQNSRRLVKCIYEITKLFPPSELYGLSNQMRRSSISISSNIAEGMGKTTIKDKSNYLHIAYGSALELLCQLVLALDLEFIKLEVYNQIRNELESILGQIINLKKSLSINKNFK